MKANHGKTLATAELATASGLTLHSAPAAGAGVGESERLAPAASDAEIVKRCFNTLNGGNRPTVVQRAYPSPLRRWRVREAGPFLVLLLYCLVHQGGAIAQKLPYGPDTCQNGFVFREAYPNDHVCVTTKVRQQVAIDNSRAAANVQPGGGAYGKDTCKNGLVWRQARSEDHVCVTPEQRTQAVDDDRYAYSRQQARLLETRPKPIKPVRSGSGSVPDYSTYHPGSGATGEQNCKDRYVCPPRMKIAVEDATDTCVCKRS